MRTLIEGQGAKQNKLLNCIEPSAASVMFMIVIMVVIMIMMMIVIMNIFHDIIVILGYS